MLRAALIGTGEIALQHLACLRALPNVTLVGVCDRSEAFAEAAAERFGVGAWFTDHRLMFDAIRPDVVHITTPPPSHFELSMDALEFGAHVIVEKPVTTSRDALSTLLQSAADKHRMVIEDYNYLFNAPVLEMVSLARSGALGDILHVEVVVSHGRDDGRSTAAGGEAHDGVPGAAVNDFLPHMVSLIHCFTGRYRAVRSRWSTRRITPSIFSDEFRAAVDSERGTATLAFSTHGRPETFWVRVHGTRMRVSAELYDMSLTTDRLDDGPRPLARLRNRLREARQLHGTAVRGFLKKLTDGLGTYDGLWYLLERTYAALEAETAPPVSPRQITEINDCIAALNAEEFRF